MTDFVAKSTKMNNRFIIKNNRISKHLTKFKTLPSFRVDVRDVWSLTLINDTFLGIFTYTVA